MKRLSALVIIMLTVLSVWAQTNIFPTTGNAGIGTTIPVAKLHIVNGNHSYGAILAQANESPFQLYTKTLSTQPAYIESFRLGLKYGVNENNGYISFYRGGSVDGGWLGLATNGIERMSIITNGNVGIGTKSPAYKLDVNGTIRTRELKVDMQGADFVFEKDYKLRSLSEVEEFIQTNNHLPDIAPAKEMQENGVNQSEMNKLLLQKVEELTLYSIQQNKLIYNQRNIIEDQRGKLDSYSDRLLKIEKLLNKIGLNNEK